MAVRWVTISSYRQRFILFELTWLFVLVGADAAVDGDIKAHWTFENSTAHWQRACLVLSVCCTVAHDAYHYFSLCMFCLCILCFFVVTYRFFSFSLSSKLIFFCLDFLMGFIFDSISPVTSNKRVLIE